MSEDIQPHERPLVQLYFSPVHPHEGKWRFWDETWCDRIGPYDTFTQAKQQLNEYAKHIEDGSPFTYPKQ